jgi:hypothetical protein
MMTAGLCFVTPFRVAFTKRANMPATDPAVKVIEEPLEELSVPRERVRVQA